MAGSSITTTGITGETSSGLVDRLMRRSPLWSRVLDFAWLHPAESDSGAAVARWARVCASVGTRPVPPRPPTTSDDAAAASRAAVTRSSPSTSRAVRVPTYASPAPVWSTTAGAGTDGIQADTSASTTWTPEAPQVTATISVPSARSRSAAATAESTPSRAAVSPGWDGVINQQSGASSVRSSAASAAPVSRGR